MFSGLAHSQLVDYNTGLKNQPTIPIQKYGAKCDGVTDDAVAIRTALTLAAVTGGRVTVGPNGANPTSTPCLIKSSFIITESAEVDGLNSIASQISIPATGGTWSTVSSTLCGGTSCSYAIYINAIHYSGISTIALNLNGNTSVQVGIYMNEANEQIFVNKVNVINATMWGILVDGLSIGPYAVQNFGLEDIYISMATTAANDHCLGIYSAISRINPRNITCYANSQQSSLAGIVINGVINIYMEGIHVEEFDDGIDVIGSDSIFINGWTGHSTLINGIYFSSTTTAQHAVMNYTANGNTNTICDATTIAGGTTTACKGAANSVAITGDGNAYIPGINIGPSFSVGGNQIVACSPTAIAIVSGAVATSECSVYTATANTAQIILSSNGSVQIYSDSTTPTMVFTPTLRFTCNATGCHVGPLNYNSIENGSNNAIAINSINNPLLVTGLFVTIQLAHSLQAGANTFAYQGGSAVAIKSHFNVANNIGTAYANTGTIVLEYNGSAWLDLSQ